MISFMSTLFVSRPLRLFSWKSQLPSDITWIFPMPCFTQIFREVGREPVEIHFSKVWPSLRRLLWTPYLFEFFFFLTRNEISRQSDRRFSHWYRVTHKARRMNGHRLNVRVSFLGAFAKLRKKKHTISCVISLSLSVRMQQLGSHWTDFY